MNGHFCIKLSDLCFIYFQILNENENASRTLFGPRQSVSARRASKVQGVQGQLSLTEDYIRQY
jgi:hypothetical protein